MGTLTRCIITVGLLIPGTALSGQKALTGTWQGILQTPKALNGGSRCILQITNGDRANLKATYHNLDETGGRGFDATTISLKGSTLKISIVALGASYEGKLSPDGNSIAGRWSDGLTSRALDFKRATPQSTWTIPDPLPAVQKASSSTDDLEFEVSTIKPTKPGTSFTIHPTRGGTLIGNNVSLGYLIKFAYEVHPSQIIDGPDWLETAKYDLTAKPAKEGQPNLKQTRVMVGKLLADRFQLSFHMEKKIIPVYAVVVAKGGAKLSVNDTNPGGSPAVARSSGGITATNSTIAEFAGFVLNEEVDRPVVDQTGFGATRYNFALKWTPDASLVGVGEPAAGVNQDTPPGIFTALQQQLGLKLQPTKAALDVLVVDRVEPPSPN